MLILQLISIRWKSWSNTGLKCKRQLAQGDTPHGLRNEVGEILRDSSVGGGTTTSQTTRQIVILPEDDDLQVKITGSTPIVDINYYIQSGSKRENAAAKVGRNVSIKWDEKTRGRLLIVITNHDWFPLEWNQKT